MNKTVYFHVCVYGTKWISIYRDIMDSIIYSRLIDEATIYVNYVGDTDQFEKLNTYVHKNLFFCNKGPVIYTYEYPTLMDLYSDAVSNDGYYLYIHTKGATRGEAAVEGWRKYLTHFNIDKWKDAVELLEQHSAVGVDYQEGTPHPQAENVGWYAGNFWWTKSSHVRKLLSPANYSGDRLLAEFWIGRVDKEKFATMWQSNNNHYVNYYEEINYKK